MELLHFTATWCQPCKQMEPLISKFINDNDSINYIKIDVDKESDLVSEHEIKGVPTFISLPDGKIINRHTGVLSENGLKELFF